MISSNNSEWIIYNIYIFHNVEVLQQPFKIIIIIIIFLYECYVSCDLFLGWTYTSKVMEDRG